MPDDPKTSPEFKALARNVVLRTFGQERHTQDSPILPDVWIKFAASAPDERIDLILTPKTGQSPGKIAQFLRERTPQDDPNVEVNNAPVRNVARIAAIRNAVCARLTLTEVLVLVTPMTDWWPGVCGRICLAGIPAAERSRFAKNVVEACSGQSFRDAYWKLDDVLEWGGSVAQAISREGLWDFYRFVALAGFVQLCQTADGNENALKGLAAALVDPSQVVQSFMPLVERFTAGVEEMARTMDAVAEAGQQGTVWSVTLNRPASPALSASRSTIKADAAQALFRISTRDITWAVVDGGIDARHPAFLDRSVPGPISATGDIPVAASRVRRTYDFTWLRNLLATGAFVTDDATKELPAWVERNAKEHSPKLAKHSTRLHDGEDIDWDLIEPLLRIPHDEQYAPPALEHGTHVAGIIGGDWKKADNPEDDDLVGMAPDIGFIDIRVFDASGGDEFTIVSALQFIMHLNRRRDLPVVHGVNLSLSLAHDVQSFACGQTPICQECNRLGSNGLVMVAAAGNRGLEDGTGDGTVFETYRDISITDPGNADGVITVGATHRSEPHTYGVSYFSSRGPTGDGRRKPDLVAPGEKIVGPVPGCGVRRMDGTSMAAPHVSGAAALLMSRHRELIGQPRAIKDILCRTATDLGREPYFQGAGLVDILRALQSV